MGGCLRSIGCLVVVAAIAVAAFLLRDRWLPLLHRSPTHAAAPGGQAWELLTPEGADRAKVAIEKLNARSGPVFANVDGADLAAYILQELSKELPPSAMGTQAAVIGDELYVRATVDPKDFGGASTLGPLAGVMGSREPVEFGGTMDIVKPGLGEYRVMQLKIHDLSIPHAMIPRLLRQYERGARPPGIADDALPLVVPVHIADVRIHNGRITLYKSTH